MADVKIRFVPETQEALKAIQDVQDSVNALFQSSQGSSANFAIFDTINDSLTSISLNIENVSDQLSAFETTAFQNLSAELGTVNQTLQEVNQTLQEVASSSIDPDTQGIQSVEEEIMDVIDAAREAVDVIASIEEAVGDDIDEFMSLEFGTHELSEELNEALQTFIEARERARELREELENISDVGYLDNATEQQREYNKAAEEAGEAQREFVRAAKEASESTQQLTDDRVDQIKAIQDSIDSFAVHNTQARRLLGAFRQSSIAVSDFRKALSESNAELSDFIDISYRATRTLEILLNSFQVGLDRIFTLENIQETIDSLGRGSEVLFENIADGIIAVEERWTRLQQVLTTIRAHVGNVFFESETGAAPFIDVRPILNNINDVFTNIRTQTANSFSDLANRVRDIANSVGRVFDFGAFFRRFRGPDFDVGPARRVGQLALPPPVDPFPNAAPTPQDIGRVQQYAMVVQNATDIVTQSAKSTEINTTRNKSLGETVGQTARVVSEFTNVFGGLSDQQEETNRSARSLIGVFTRTGLIIAGAALAVGGLRKGLGGLLGGVIETTSNFQTMQATLRVTERDVDKVSDRLIELNKQTTGIEIDTLLSGFTQLRIANQSVEQAETALRATALASSELGKSSAVTARVIEQLTQAYASNTAEAQDLKTIFREIPQLSRAATKALGVHVGGWKDFAEVVRETQDLDLRTAFNRTFDVLDRTALGGDINTFAVQQERLKEGIQDIQKDIGGVLVPALTDALKVANNFVNSGAIQSIGRFFFEAAKYIVPFGVAFGTVFTIQKIRLIVRAGAFFVQLGNQIRQFATNAIARLQAFRASILRTNTATQALNNVNLSRVSGTGSRALGLLRSGFDTARNAVRGFVASLGPAGIAIVALTAAGKIWIDIIEQQRRALQLQEQVLKGYNISILSVADALKSVSETDFSALTEIQQTLNEDIREFREEIEATEGLWQRFIQGITNLSGFGANPVTGDIGANLRRRIAAQEGIENAERNLQRIQDVLNENVTIQARINALEQLRLDFQKGVEAASQNVLAAEKEFAETRKASDEANLTARKQALQLAKNQSDELDGILESLKEQLTVQERINEEQPVLPIDLSRATASIRDLEQALDTAQEGTNVELIEQTTKALVEAYSDQTLLRLRHARQTIEDEKDLQARLFELNDENIRRRISAIEESNKRRDELRREDLPLLPSLEDFRAAQQATDEYFARIEARRDVFRNLGTSAVQTFRNVRESVIGAGDTIQSIFDTLANGADALVNRFYAINGVVAQLRDVSELAFPQVTDFVGRLGNAWSGLSERQRELLPFFGRYRAAAIETVNAITGPFRSLGNAFRESDLSSILRPGVVDRGRELQEEDRVERLRELNEASEMLNRESLQRSQAIFRSAFSNIERAISSFDLSAPVIDNLKRIASAFLASTARIVLEARVSYLIQKKYDDDLTASKLANLAKVTAANTASNASILSGAAAATSTPTNVLSTAGTLASTLNPFTALLSAPLQLVINNIIGNRTIETITQESRFNRLEGL